MELEKPRKPKRKPRTRDAGVGQRVERVAELPMCDDEVIDEASSSAIDEVLETGVIAEEGEHETGLIADETEHETGVIAEERGRGLTEESKGETGLIADETEHETGVIAEERERGLTEESKDETGLKSEQETGLREEAKSEETGLIAEETEQETSSKEESEVLPETGSEIETEQTGLTVESVAEIEQTEPKLEEPLEVTENMDIPPVIEAEPVHYPSLPTELLPEFKPGEIEHRKIIHQFEQVAQVDPNQLLTEEQLRSFYLNEELEIVDDFVEAFIQNELIPNENDAFVELLARYLDASRQLEVKETELGELERKCQSLNEQIWELQTHTVTQSGRCGDDRAASGSANYQTAKLRQEILIQLQETLAKRANCNLQEKLLMSTTAKATSLQCHWCVVRANHGFMAEHRLTVASPACVSFGAATNVRENATRTRIRFCLTSLFHFLRMPLLPTAFVTDLKSWITELGCVLLKASTEMDHLFLLCHLLRTSISLDEWAVAMVQPYCMSTNSDTRLSTDHFIGMLFLLLSSVRRREEFLSRFVQSELEDQDGSWTIVDDDGEEEESRLVATTESDLISLLNQFNFADLFGNLFKLINFSNMSESDVLTLFAFHLTTTKVLFDGMQTYNRPQYKQLCKQIGYVIRQSVRYVAEYWEHCHTVFRTEPTILERLTREFDRLLLFDVHCLISSEKLGVWQFLVDFPYKQGSAECLCKVQLLLLSPTTYRFSELCAMKIDSNQMDLSDSNSLVHRLAEVNGSDGTYLLSTLANVASASGDPKLMDMVATSIFNICFANEATREQFHKVGSEAISSFVEKHPPILSTILRLIDRHLDQVDAFTPEVLTLAPVSICRPQIEDIVLLGKWLVGRDPSCHASRLARRLLSNFNWGPTNGDTSLWIPTEIHLLAAETIVKSHIAHCKAQNGLISASIRKASKIALRIPDLEQQFDAFCWDVLLRLKFDTTETEPPSQPNDLAVFFVSVMRYHLKSPSTFIKEAVPLLNSLVDSGCVMGAIWIVARVVFSFAAHFENLLQNQGFLSCVDKVIHAEQSSLVAALLGASDAFPGKYLKLISSAMAYQLNTVSGPLEQQGHFDHVLTTWVRLLTSSRPDWNNDRCVLYLLNNIVRCAFVKNIKFIDVIREILKVSYQTLIHTASQQSKGVLGWISGSDSTPPTLIGSEWFAQFPWVAFVALFVEELSFASLITRLDEVMLKHATMALEQSLKVVLLSHVSPYKKACNKEHLSFGVERLPYYRWADLCCAMANDHPLLPLACQQLAIRMLKRVKIDNPTCVGLRYLRCRSSHTRLETLKTSLEAAAEMRKDFPDSSGQFIGAVSQWLWNSQLYNPYNTATDNVPMDYLAQLVISGDKVELWLNFVQMDSIGSSVDRQRQPFVSLSHLAPPTGSIQPIITKPALERLFDRLQNESSKSVPPPEVPRTNNPPPPLLEMDTLCQARRLLAIVGPCIEMLATKAANSFVLTKDSERLMNGRFIELLPLLYQMGQTQLTIDLRCSSGLIQSCSKPLSTKMNVSACSFSSSIDSKVKQNRQQRLTDLQKMLSAANKDAWHVQAAVLEESIGTLVQTATETPRNSERFTSLMDSGMTLFYHIISTTGSVATIFPVSREVIGRCIDLLGQKFVADMAAQQEHLVDVLLQRQELAEMLVPNFTPRCLEPGVFLTIYARIAQTLKAGNLKSTLALSLVSKVDLPRLLQMFSPTDVCALMPIAFETSVRISSLKDCLYEAYKAHFLGCAFHNFPANFIEALKLMLKSGSDGSLPSDLLIDLNSSIGASNLEIAAEYNISPNTAIEAFQQLTIAFEGARAHCRTLWSTWQTYFEPLCILIGFLFHRMTATLDLQQSLDRVENDTSRLFERLSGIFAPWLVPPGGVVIPWTPDNGPSAALLLRQFVASVSQLHLITDKCLPAGSQNVISLMWMFYIEKMSNLKRACGHVHSLYEEHLLKLPWASFWPNLAAMDSMQKVLSDGPIECHPFVCNVFVRIPWLSLDQFTRSQPADASKAFYGLLLDILLRCGADHNNYQNCKASFPNLVNSVTACNWTVMDINALEKSCGFVANNFKPKCLDVKESDIHAALFKLLRFSCGFVSPNPSTESSESLSKKQALFVNCYLKLLNRGLHDGTITVERGKTLFTSLLAENEMIVRNRASLTPDVSLLLKECARFIDGLKEETIMESMLKTLNDFVLDNPDAQLILLLLYCALDGSAPSLVYIGFGIIESCISAYFLSSRQQPTWAEIIGWLNVPLEFQRPLRQETTSGGPFLLTLYGCLLQILPVCQSIEAEGKILKEIIRLLNILKPKRISEEGCLLLIMQKMVELLVRQCQFSGDPQNNGLALNTVKQWLLLQTEEKPGSFLNVLGISKKPSYSARFKLVCQVLNLFLTQQTLDGVGQVRLDANMPVTNARIETVKTLKSQKQFVPFADKLETAVIPFFTNVNNNLISAPLLLGSVVKALYIERYLHLM